MHFVGILPGGKREYFQADKEPVASEYGHQYTYVVGPFKTKRAALWAEKYGQGNPHFRHVDDAERISRTMGVRESKEAEMKYIRKNTGGRPTETYESLEAAYADDEVLSASYDDERGRVWEVASIEELVGVIDVSIEKALKDRRRTQRERDPDKLKQFRAKLDGLSSWTNQTVDGEELWAMAYPDGDPYADTIIERPVDEDADIDESYRNLKRPYKGGRLREADVEESREVDPEVSTNPDEIVTSGLGEYYIWSLRELAMMYHDGQWSALYAFGSSGTITPGLSAEATKAAELAEREDGEVDSEIEELGIIDVVDALKVIASLEDRLPADVEESHRGGDLKRSLRGRRLIEATRGQQILKAEKEAIEGIRKTLRALEDLRDLADGNASVEQVIDDNVSILDEMISVIVADIRRILLLPLSSLPISGDLSK